MDTGEELTECVCLLIQTIRRSTHLSAKTKDFQPSLLEAVWNIIICVLYAIQAFFYLLVDVFLNCTAFDPSGPPHLGLICTRKQK